MRNEMMMDEYGYELTEEDLEENDRIAREALEDIKEGLADVKKKKAGRSKGKSRKTAVENEDFNKAVDEMIESSRQDEKEEIAPAQMDPMDVKVPEAVRKACVNRIEEIEALIATNLARISELESDNRNYEAEYKVLTDFIFRKGK